ncbi:hypothetical protein RLIN73S_02135 [Rhodanobacter lindaniclasticus]
MPLVQLGGKVVEAHDRPFPALLGVQRRLCHHASQCRELFLPARGAPHRGSCSKEEQRSSRRGSGPRLVCPCRIPAPLRGKLLGQRQFFRPTAAMARTSRGPSSGSNAATLASRQGRERWIFTPRRCRSINSAAWDSSHSHGAKTSSVGAAPPRSRLLHYSRLAGSGAQGQEIVFHIEHANEDSAAVLGRPGDQRMRAGLEAHHRAGLHQLSDRGRLSSIRASQRAPGAAQAQALDIRIRCDGALPRTRPAAPRPFAPAPRVRPVGTSARAKAGKPSSGTLVSARCHPRTR